MSDTKTAVVTAIVGDLVEGTSAKTGKAYRFQGLTIIQRGRNHNENYFLKDGAEPLAPGKYEFDVAFASGPDGRTRVYFNSPRSVA